MRILCLHGHGTGPGVMEYQTSVLRKFADPSWEFVFACGEVECPPAQGTKDTFPEPYYCWSKEFDQASEQAAHALVEELIEEEGPFDGVLGFSQGAAIALSYMLQQTASHEELPLPFSFAFFFSATAPFSADPAYFGRVLGPLSDDDQGYIRSGEDESIAQLPEPSRTAIKSLIKLVDGSIAITNMERAFYFDRPSIDKIPCVLHPGLSVTRLGIPTLHVRGMSEPSEIQECSLLVESFCEPKKVRSFKHTAGHDIPRSEGEARQIMSLMERVALQSTSLA